VEARGGRRVEADLAEDEDDASEETDGSS